LAGKAVHAWFGTWGFPTKKIFAFGTALIKSHWLVIRTIWIKTMSTPKSLRFVEIN
jgi:hypothetical protein